MSRSWRRHKAQPPFEEWDGSTEALQARQSYDRRRPRPPTSPSSLEIDRLIESAVRERRRGPRAGFRPPVRSGDSSGAAGVVADVTTLDDLWSIWSLSPAPREPGGQAEG